MADAIDRKRDEEVLADADEALPVVARLVIEIRSDGSRTVARGALEDANRGERVGIAAEGGSPAELAAKLLRSLVAAPVQAAMARMTGAQRPVLTDSEEPGGLVARMRRRATQALLRRLARP